jgi:predicted transcriptional regulator
MIPNRSRIIETLRNSHAAADGDRSTPAHQPILRSAFVKHRASPLHHLLADRRVDLLSRIDGGQKSVETLEKETGIPKKTVYRYLKDFIRLGVVRRSTQSRIYLYSFSAYGEYGIDLGLRDNYYTLPKRELSIKEVFIHSLDSAEDLRQRLFCILFYLKNGNKLESIDRPMMEDIKAALQGESIKGYPSLEEIEDRAELYEIELQI